MHKQQGSALTVTVITLLIVALLGTLGFVFYQNFVTKPATENTNVNEPAETAVKTKTFTSKEKGISFKYPGNWTVVETPSEGNTDAYYGTSISLANETGKELALLQTGGGLGGSCPDTEPFQTANTLINQPTTVQGLAATSFGYTIVASDDGTYGVAFGLADQDKLKSGEESVKCPAMSVNYDYIVKTNDPALAQLMFGLWYSAGNTMMPYLTFDTFDEAKAYIESTEFKTIETTIKSLTIAE